MVVLGGVAVAASGWIWGFHHYQIASGAKFSDDERLLFIVRDELEKMEAENALLRAKLKELMSKDDVAGESAE